MVMRARRTPYTALPLCLVLAIGGAAAPANASSSDQVRPVPDGADFQPPKPVHQEKPRYTASGRKARIEGEVVLRAVVETDGSVTTVTVERSLDTEHGLDDAAIAAAKLWRFEPGRIKGEAVRVRVTIALTFTL